MPEAAESRIAHAFGLRGRGIDDAVAVAELMGSTWLAIDDAVRGVIGARGVNALYCRGLRLTVAQHAWLAAACADPGPG